MLIKAVDAAQEADAPSHEALAWDGHVLKSGEPLAYVPFRLTHNGAADGFTSTVMYVRAVTRRDGARASEEHSFLREWLARGGDVPQRMGETVYVGPGEMPVGGPATSSSRRAISAPAEALAVLALQQRAFEKQAAANAAAKTTLETKERDPLRFAFEGRANTTSLSGCWTARARRRRARRSSSGPWSCRISGTISSRSAA